MPIRDTAFKTAASARAKSINQWPLLLVVLGEAAGLFLIWIGHWRWGNLTMGASLCAGALLRLVLPARVAGLLQVRTRIADIVMLAGVGVVIMVLAVAMPQAI